MEIFCSKRIKLLDNAFFDTSLKRVRKEYSISLHDKCYIMNHFICTLAEMVSTGEMLTLLMIYLPDLAYQKKICPKFALN